MDKRKFSREYHAVYNGKQTAQAKEVYYVYVFGDVQVVSTCREVNQKTIIYYQNEGVIVLLHNCGLDGYLRPVGLRGSFIKF